MTEAKKRLSELINKVEQGEDVVITRRGHPVARLVKFQVVHEPRVPGSLKGKLEIDDDFDMPGPGLEKLFMDGAINPF